VSFPANTVRFSKWAKVMGALAVPVTVGAAAMGLAAPASADGSSYLQTLRPTYAYLGDSQLMAAGNQACATARSGVPASDNVIAVSKDLGVSTSAAYEIVIASINHLGC
jgi:hypothetical protein